jgi:Fe-S-cluster containining protein
VPSDGDHDVPAGDFSTWLTAMQAALRGEREADVPCDGCTACCTSSHFVHIEPDEADTLAHIPPRLLFPAPRRPRGHVLLGYDEHGHCPMLVDGRCSIYEHRPRTCRTYDCRVFPAAGVEADQPAVAGRAQRWRFTYASPADRTRHDEVRATAVVLRERHPEAPAAQIAVGAVEGHEGISCPR